MKNQLLHLIQTDIRFCRLTENLNKLGIHSDELGTNNILSILYFMKIDATDQAVDLYCQLIESGIDASRDQDEHLSEQIFNTLMQQLSH